MIELKRGDSRRVYETVVDLCKKDGEVPPSRTTVYDYLSGRARTNHVAARRIDAALAELKPAQTARAARKARREPAREAQRPTRRVSAPDARAGGAGAIRIGATRKARTKAGVKASG